MSAAYKCNRCDKLFSGNGTHEFTLKIGIHYKTWISNTNFHDICPRCFVVLFSEYFGIDLEMKFL